MRAILLAALAALTLLAPASAQETECPEGEVATPEGCSQQAWVDDCPPDMMCAAASPEGGDGGCDADACSHAPADGSPPDFTTCMDGAHEGEDCDDDVVYFGPGPADTGVAPSQGDDEGHGAADTRDAAGLALLIVTMALVAAAIASLRRTA